MMNGIIDYPLSSHDPLTTLARQMGARTWYELTSIVRNLPYGRNKTKTDPSLVLKEQKGTCSSKHGLLKSIADLNHIKDVDLILAIYRMHQRNTPQVAEVLSEHDLPYMLEAHCYIKQSGQSIDCTSTALDLELIRPDIIDEMVITPAQLNNYKSAYHKSCLEHWIVKDHLPYTLSQLWDIREDCIEALSRPNRSRLEG